MHFSISKEKKPAGDQGKAISALVKGLEKNAPHQTLLGVTGSGKTFTIAHTIAQYNKPAIVIAHNKTLAAQLAQEFRELFPTHAVHYFVSYYDYYQPEAYVPGSDTYIAKEAQVNAEIDRLRHATTQSLLTRKDVIVVASVSAIYGLGSPAEYEKVHLKIQKGAKQDREDFIRALIGLQFERTADPLQPGYFRVIGDVVEIMPVNEEVMYRITFSQDTIGQIEKIDVKTSEMLDSEVPVFFLFPAKHFVSNKDAQEKALTQIEDELAIQLDKFAREGKELERERLRRRTLQDISLIREIGYCRGIENYSRHFDFRAPGEAPHTLLSYLSYPEEEQDFLTIIDESHVTVSQIEGMYAGDRARKETLIAHGFRLPSAVDNRPLRYEEFEERIGPVIYVSATPGTHELEKSGKHVIEQIIRPTGLVDPAIVVKPVSKKDEYKGQVQDFIQEAKEEIAKGSRVLVTTLSKKTAEDLASFLSEAGVHSAYIHSDVKTIERIELLTNFRKGDFDVLVGVNLLREGLDLPEVSLVAILDADKEGFLRSETSLIQTIGRAARNENGRVLLYADEMTQALESAITETKRRRDLQLAYNKKHGITPKTIIKSITDIVQDINKKRVKTAQTLMVMDNDAYKKAPQKFIKEKRAQMENAVKELDFETAALIRDELQLLEKKENK